MRIAVGWTGLCSGSRSAMSLTPARKGPHKTPALRGPHTGVSWYAIEGRPRAGGQELCRWLRGRTWLGETVVCWELEGSSQGWVRDSGRRYTIILTARSPKLHNISRWSGYPQQRRNHREVLPSAPYHSSTAISSQPAFSQGSPLRSCPDRDATQTDNCLQKQEKLSHSVHLILLLWTVSIPLGLWSGTASTGRPQCLARPRLYDCSQTVDLCAQETHWVRKDR